MIQEREVQIGSVRYPVTISDRQQALQAAKAAGRAVVGYLHEGSDPSLTPADYLVETLEAADEKFLEQVVRRHLGLPWEIGSSGRLLIRELNIEDLGALQEAARWEHTAPDSPDGLFCRAETLAAYIHSQYRFYEYGIWAVIRKSDGRLIGKVGVFDVLERHLPETKKPPAPQEMQLELGYHIFLPYRGQGYGTEACRLILDYVKDQWDCPVYAAVSPENEPSLRLLDRLGFVRIDQTHSGETPPQCLYAANWP